MTEEQVVSLLTPLADIYGEIITFPKPWPDGWFFSVDLEVRSSLLSNPSYAISLWLLKSTGQVSRDGFPQMKESLIFRTAFARTQANAVYSALTVFQDFLSTLPPKGPVRLALSCGLLQTELNKVKRKLRDEWGVTNPLKKTMHILQKDG